MMSYLKRIVIVSVVLYGCIMPVGHAQQNDKPTRSQCQSFACGNTVLCEQDQVSSDTVSEGDTYAVICRITNLGPSAGDFSTNFMFTDPNKTIVDGSRGPTLYHLEPNQSITLDWHHAFGCIGRLKGEYVLGIGTQVTGLPPGSVLCNDYHVEDGIGYHDVTLTNDTICPGFRP